MQVRNERDAIGRLRHLIVYLKEELKLPSQCFYSGPDNSIAEHFKIKIVERRLGEEHDEGEYIPGNPSRNIQPTIIVNSSVTSHERKNFTFFHEVTHHIVRDDDLLYGFIHEHAVDEHFDIAVEKFCNIGAAEFLLPQSAVAEIIHRDTFSIQLIPVIDAQFGMSLPAACIQLAQCATHECKVVLCHFGALPLQRQPDFNQKQHHKECFHVLYASSSPSFKYQSGRYLPVPTHHLLHDAYRKRGFVSGRDVLLFKSNNGWRVDCEALYYRDRVFGLFNVKPPPQNNHQLSLLPDF